MPKTKAEVAKMVRVNKTKQYSKLSTEQQQAKYKSIMESPRKDTAVAKIELSVLRKLFLASKKSAPKKTPAPSRKSIEKEAITDAKKKYNNFTLKQLLKERKTVTDAKARTDADYTVKFAKQEVIYDLLKKFTKDGTPAQIMALQPAKAFARGEIKDFAKFKKERVSLKVTYDGDRDNERLPKTVYWKNDSVKPRGVLFKGKVKFAKGEEGGAVLYDSEGEIVFKKFTEAEKKKREYKFDVIAGNRPSAMFYMVGGFDAFSARRFDWKPAGINYTAYLIEVD
tara:strand:- start:181 stop:1026 length:846 start_codon:yes stop_codon:yes gene_type:complete